MQRKYYTMKKCPACGYDTSNRRRNVSLNIRKLLAVREKKTIIVNDVHEYDNYISCDSESLSEIVIPIFRDDDIIAVLSEKLVEKFNSTVFIVSSDKDFLQLVTKKIILYRPMEKEYYTPEAVRQKYGILPYNFIVYKTLLGDNSDKIPGVKGL